MARAGRRLIAPAPGRIVREHVKWEFFDTKTYPAAGVGNLIFFANPTAGPLSSNMQGNGQLPMPKEFDVYGIAVEIFPYWGEPVAEGIKDMWVIEKKKIRESAWLRFIVGDKPYLTQPLVRIPEGMGWAGFALGADEDTGAYNQSVMTQGIPDVNHYYPLFVRIKNEMVPITIPSQQRFYVEIYWQTTVVTTETGHTSNVGRIRVYLIGHLKREVQ